MSLGQLAFWTLFCLLIGLALGLFMGVNLGIGHALSVGPDAACANLRFSLLECLK